MRVRLDVAYDGTGYAGWARQPDQRTVAGVLEAALATVLRLREPARLTAAGRTDAGVHARGQVAHVDLPATAWLALAALPTTEASLARRLAGVLPRDVRVTGVRLAPVGFDARFSALARRYAYRVADTLGACDPLRRQEVHWHQRPLDLETMKAASAGLLGEHDFAAFCRRRAGATTVRTLRRLSWERAEGGLAVATVVADAFCHSMVRALVGALLAVGDGRRTPDWPGELLARRVRDPAVTVAPAHGLCLEEVHYPPDGELAARAKHTRRRRDPPD